MRDITFTDIFSSLRENSSSTKADPLFKAGQGVLRTPALNVVPCCILILSILNFSLRSKSPVILSA